MVALLLLIGLALACGMVALFFYACTAPASQVLGPTLVSGPAAGNRIALTFDDGPAHPFTGQVLDILREARVPATFFVCGKNVERFPEIVRRMQAEKHTIGNHTYSHPALYFKTRGRIAEEIDRTQAAIEKAAGVRPRLFRPPYGGRWLGLFDVLEQRGMRVIQWSVASFDWEKKRGSDEIARMTLDQLRPGSVILLHDGREPRAPGDVDAASTVAALPAILEGARKAGLEFVSVDEFLS